jgi:hypothetical protein
VVKITGMTPVDYPLDLGSALVLVLEVIKKSNKTRIKMGPTKVERCSGARSVTRAARFNLKLRM